LSWGFFVNIALHCLLLQMNVRHVFSFFLLPPFLLLLGIAQPSFIKAQSDSTLTDSSTYFFTQHHFLAKRSEFNDTSFYRFTEYDNIGLFPALGIGNAGHARYSPVFGQKSMQPSLFKGFESYLNPVESIPYFSTVAPHSEVTYISGAKREQFFKLRHSRNFGDPLNIQLALTKRGSEGFYNHLRTNHTFFNFSSNYTSPNQRYGLLAHYRIDRLIAQENGGYSNFDQVDNPEFSGTSFLDQAVNRVKNQGVYTRQHYRFGKSSVSYDKDSNALKEFTPLLELAYVFEHDKNQKVYEDPAVDPLYYPAIFIDSTATFDTIGQLSYTNRFTLSLLNGEYAYVGLMGRHHFFKHRQTAIADTSFNNYAVGGFVHWRNESSAVYADVDYTLVGYNEQDVSSQLTYHYKNETDSSSWRVQAKLAYSLITPEFFLNHYRSNHYEWFNSFEQIETYDVHLHINWKGFTAEGNYQLTDGAIAWNTNANPFQYNQQLNAANGILSKTLGWKNFYLTNRIALQATSNEAVLPLPLYVLNESLHYQNFLFKNALFTRIGVQCFYYAKHRGYAYAPALNQFYISADTKDNELGQYPYFDFFVDLKIKQMKLFIKWAHFNEGSSGNNFFRLPLYPHQQRAILFGLNWVLAD
jgi:hypothetical protein